MMVHLIKQTKKQQRYNSNKSRNDKKNDMMRHEIIYCNKDAHDQNVSRHQTSAFRVGSIHVELIAK